MKHIIAFVFYCALVTILAVVILGIVITREVMVLHDESIVQMRLLSQIGKLERHSILLEKLTSVQNSLRDYREIKGQVNETDRCRFSSIFQSFINSGCRFAAMRCEQNNADSLMLAWVSKSRINCTSEGEALLADNIKICSDDKIVSMAVISMSELCIIYLNRNSCVWGKEP